MTPEERAEKAERACLCQVRGDKRVTCLACVSDAIRAAVAEERRNNLQGFGGRLKDCCSEEVLAAIAKCVEEERETCAKLAENVWVLTYCTDSHKAQAEEVKAHIAASIRSRGEKQ